MGSKPQVMFGCVSHSPLIIVREEKPAFEDQLIAECQVFREKVKAFNPDYIVFFSNDHFASFYYDNMPAYCIGTRSHAVDDVGGTPGVIPAREDVAVALTASVRKAGFDPAISYNMRIDHGFSQPLNRLLGAVDAYPLIPIFISAFTQPLLSFGRSRLFGEAVGRFLAETGDRVLIMGSGGISHHPVRYYPFPDDAEPAVYAWQMAGPKGGGLNEQQWFQRLDELHRDGAHAVAIGQRTQAQMRLNPEFDTGFLDRIASGDLAVMDDWDQTEILANAGAGALEIHNWIAARAAYAAAGQPTAVETRYTLAVPYAVGYALAQSGLPPA